MNESLVTPLEYFKEVLATSWKHGGEMAVALSCAIAAGLSVLAARSLLHLQALDGPGQVMLVVVPPIAAVLLLEAGVAAWRLHRRQHVVLATRQLLLDTNASDHAEHEQVLRARYHEREERLAARHATRLQRMSGEIAALRPAPSTGARVELNRADDDGWPIKGA